MATSFNGPLKVYQRVNPTNDGSGNSLVPNSGAAAVWYDYNSAGTGAATTPNIARIPAGSRISNVVVLFNNPSTTAYTGATLSVQFLPDGGSASTLGSITMPAVAAGTSAYATVTWASTQPGAILSNVGLTAGYLQIASENIPVGAINRYSTEYVIRNTDGTITNTGANLSNN